MESPDASPPSLSNRGRIHANVDPSLLSKFIRTWKGLQVSYYGGKYSIHRLLALDEYTRKTPLYRAVLASAGAPMPVVVLVLIQESIPLQDPAAGWRENYGFWIRSAILAFVISMMATDQTRFLIDGVAISWWRLVLLSLCASGMFTVCAITVAAHSMFPVPFFALTMAPIFYPLLILSYRVVVGRRIFRHILERRDQLIRYVMFVCTEVMIAAVYAAYEALYRLAKGSSYQILVILLLPVIKVAAKNIVLQCMKHREDMVPEAVIFTVDFFNAIYLATCMQSATSTFAVIAISITDISQTIVMLFGLHKRTTTIVARLRDIVGNSQQHADLVKALCSLCRSPEKFEKQVRTGVRVTSCYPHALSDENKVWLDKLANLPSTNSTRTTGPDCSAIQEVQYVSTFERLRSFYHRSRMGPTHQIVPESTAQRTSSSAKQLDLLRVDALATRNTVLGEALEVLFSLECLVATAYLEAAIPFFYSCYIVVMVFLPAAQYHTEMAGITFENVGSKVRVLHLFGLLQVLSFGVLGFLIKRNCGMQAWYHLAFVHEAQMSLIQGKLAAWVIVTLCFRVVHFGTVLYYYTNWGCFL